MFATASLPPGSRFPILSQNIFVGDQSALTTAAWLCSENVYAFPTRPGLRGKDITRQAVWNPGSAIRLVSSDASRSMLDMVNAKMDLLACPVVLSVCGQALELSGNVPSVLLTKQVLHSEEIVCVIDPTLYWRPQPKDAGRPPKRARSGAVGSHELTE